jgi:hypothetical protein
LTAIKSNGKFPIKKKAVVDAFVWGGKEEGKPVSQTTYKPTTKTLPFSFILIKKYIHIILF